MQIQHFKGLTNRFKALGVANSIISRAEYRWTYFVISMEMMTKDSALHHSYSLIVLVWNRHGFYHIIQFYRFFNSCSRIYSKMGKQRIWIWQIMVLAFHLFKWQTNLVNDDRWPSFGQEVAARHWTVRKNGLNSDKIQLEVWAADKSGHFEKRR